jgi:hypothetical protein
LSARGPAVWPGNGAKASAVRLAVQTSFPMSFQQQCTTLIIQDGSFLSVTGEKRGEARARMTSKPCCADGLYPFNACDKLRAQSQSISHLSLSVRRSLCSLAPTHVQTCMEWRPCLDSKIHPQILLCKKKISHHIKMSAYIWSTKCR